MICTCTKYCFLLHQEKGNRLDMWQEWQTGELHSVLAERREVKRPLVRPRHKLTPWP